MFLRKLAFLSIFLIVNQYIYCQKIVKETKPSAIVVGFHTAGTDFKVHEIDPEINEKPYYRNILIEPYLAYNIESVLCVGAIANFQIIRSNFKPEDDLYELGGFVRYYIPIKFDVAFVRRMSFYTEASARVANYQQYSNSEYDKSKRLQYMLWSFNPLGLNFRIWKGLNIDLATELYFRSPSYRKFGVRIGVEYHFEIKKEKDDKNH